MKMQDFTANLINYYYPISDFVKASLVSYLVAKSYSDRDYDKLYAWILKNYSRKWKATPDIAVIEEAQKSIEEYASRFGTKKDALDYGKNHVALPVSEQSEQLKDYSQEIELTLAQLKKKYNRKNNTKV